MRKYQKPEIKLKYLALGKPVASLNQWLTDNHLTDAGITTYEINS